MNILSPGVGIGILLTELSKNSSLDELPLQIMQGWYSM